MIPKSFPSIMIHSRDAMANPCCCICGQIQLKYLCCTWSWLAVMESLTESFTMAFLERAKVEERERFPERYCLENTLLHQLFDFRVLPAKQAQRIRCGGSAIYISKDLTSGQYMKFTQIEKRACGMMTRCKGSMSMSAAGIPWQLLFFQFSPRECWSLARTSKVATWF